MEQTKRMPRIGMLSGKLIWKSSYTPITTAVITKSEICKQATKMAFEKASMTSSSTSISYFLESQCSALKAIV